MAKLGLVLSGGGAKGAYHVGVIKALQELGMQIDMISGASIGALNAAVLLSAKDQQQGLNHLEQLWSQLPTIKPIQTKGKESISDFLGFKKNVDVSTYISLLLASGLKLTTPIGFIGALLTFAIDRLEIKSLEGFCQQEPLSEMMEEFLNLNNLNRSIPFYISTYRIKDKDNARQNFLETLKAAKGFLKAEFLGLDNPYSEFYKIQDLPQEKQKSYILASAALPLIFEPQKDGQGNRFIDGGLGGALKSQGNTPITPLIEAGCTHIIVSHLDHGSLWHRHDFPNTIILEIRPHQSLNLSFSKLLDFSEENINKLKNQGYMDCKNEVTKVLDVLNLFHMMKDSRASLAESMQTLQQNESSLDELMRKF